MPPMMPTTAPEACPRCSPLAVGLRVLVVFALLIALSLLAPASRAQAPKPTSPAATAPKPTAPKASDAPRPLDCTFRTGISATYAKGRYARTRAKPLGFRVEAIDLEAQSAQLVVVGGRQPGALRLVRAIGANTFIEVAGEGYMNVTTVWDRDPATGLHPAVHSRHLGINGQPVVAQYTGTCRPL